MDVPPPSGGDGCKGTVTTAITDRQEPAVPYGAPAADLDARSRSVCPVELSSSQIVQGGLILIAVAIDAWARGWRR
jgi:hypothetical protein